MKRAVWAVLFAVMMFAALALPAVLQAQNGVYFETEIFTAGESVNRLVGYWRTSYRPSAAEIEDHYTGVGLPDGSYQGNTEKYVYGAPQEEYSYIMFDLCDQAPLGSPDT